MAPKALDARTAWIPNVSAPAEIEPGHRLRLASLSSLSGFPICSAPLPTSTKARHAQNTSPTPSVGSSSRSSDRIKSKPPTVIPIDDTDEEDPIAGFSEDELVVEKPKPSDCNKRKCDNNPNCLRWMGQALWEDKNKTRESFLKSPLLGPNPMDRSRAPGVPIGLKLGATCYAAALLQTWFHNQRFRNAVYRLATTLDHDQSLQTSPAHQLQTVFYGLQHSSLSAWDPKGLVESLELNEDQQQDAQEFSKLFMSMLASEFAKQEAEDLKSLVEDQFEGELSYTTECMECKTKSDRPSKFLELELTMTPNAKLEERLEALLAAETMSGDNQYLCGKCETLQDAKRRIELTSLPPIIHFSLLRFVFDPETFQRKKSKSVIRYPASIDMAQFLAPSPSPAGRTSAELNGKGEAPAASVDVGGTIYDLRGVLLHKGGSAYSGHYCAEVYNDGNDKWYSCDDEVVSEIPSRTPPRTDKPYRPVVDSSAKPGKIDSYFDKTPKAKPVKQGSNGGKRDDPFVVSDDEPETIKMGKTKSGKIVPLGTVAGSKRSARSDSSDEHTSKKAKPDSSPSEEAEARPPPYHTSKDAYMLVYARRDPPSLPTSPSEGSSVAKVTPPEEVVGAIELVNLAHQADCEEWEARQTAMVSAFDEVYEKKKAVFDVWQIKNFSEPFVLVDKSALEAWTKQGLNLKAAKKPVVDSTPIDVDAGPEPVPAPSTNESRPAASSPSHPELPLPNGDKEPARDIVDVAISSADASSKPEAAAAEPVVVEDAKVDVSAVRELATKRACEVDFQNQSLLCSHGAIDPNPVGPMRFKRISKTASDLMQSSLGCQFQPPLPVHAEEVCGICTTTIWRDKTYRLRRKTDLPRFNNLNDAETTRADFVVSRKWYNEFVTGVVPAFFDPTQERDPLPTEEPYRSDLVCIHEGKATNSGNRQTLVTPKAYAFLQTLFPGIDLWRFDDDRCPVCQAEDYQREQDSKPAKEQAEKERAALLSILRNLKKTLEHDYLETETDYVVVDPEFLRAWARWVKAPGKVERPPRMETDQYFCEHGLLDFDLNNKHDRKEDRFTALEADTYSQFAAWYGTGRRINFIYQDQELEDGRRSTVALMEPSPCADCRRNRKKEYGNGFIRAQIIPAKDDPRLPENKGKEVERSDPRSVSPPVRGYGNSQPVRQSARTRQAAIATKRKVIRITVNSQSTVKDFKVQAASQLRTSVLHLSLRKDDVDLDDNSKLLSQVDCVPGDLIQVIKADDGNQDEDAWLNDSDDDEAPPSRRVESGSGFGGTRLGGGGGPSRSAAPSSSQPPPNGNGVEDEAESGKQSEIGHVPAGDDGWEAMPVDLDVPMADPDSGKGISCNSCTFENAAGLLKCEMCDTPLT